MNADIPFAHRREYALLGRRLAVLSNDARVCAMADRAFGHWRDLPAELLSVEAPVRLRVVIARQHGAAVPEDRRIRHAWTGQHFISDAGDLRADSDLEAGICAVRASPAALDDEARFIHHVLEAHALQMVTRRGRDPLHAAAVARGGAVMLVAGPGGSGKSTLCYALVRAGWALLADDVVFLEAGGAPRVWGNAIQIGLLPDARRFFAELELLEPKRLPNGKIKVLAPAQQRSPAGVARALAVLGGPRGPRAKLTSIAPEEAIDALFANVGPGFDRYPGARATALSIASGATVARLAPAHDPNDTAEALTRWFDLATGAA